MPSFPLIKDLPLVIGTNGWQWEKFLTPGPPQNDFWLGTDKEGNKWLTKLRSDFYAYREIVFARIAQKMGWSCQSSTFIQLDIESAKELGSHDSRIHAAHWFMEEHQPQPCSIDCAIHDLIDRHAHSINELHDVEVTHILDWPKSEFAACLFGANEPPGKLITVNHEFVIIDSEQMFSTEPCPLDGTVWWNLPDGSPSPAGRALALEVCRELNGLTSSDIEDALSIPASITVQQRWPIAPILHRSHEFAAQLITSHSSPFST